MVISCRLPNKIHGLLCLQLSWLSCIQGKFPPAPQLSSSQGCHVPSKDFLAPISEHCFLSVCLNSQGRKGDRLCWGLSERAGTRQDLGHQGVRSQTEKWRVEQGAAWPAEAEHGDRWVPVTHTPSPTAGRHQVLVTLLEGLGTTWQSPGPEFSLS